MFCLCGRFSFLLRCRSTFLHCPGMSPRQRPESARPAQAEPIKTGERPDFFRTRGGPDRQRGDPRDDGGASHCAHAGARARSDCRGCPRHADRTFRRGGTRGRNAGRRSVSPDLDHDGVRRTRGSWRMPFSHGREAVCSRDRAVRLGKRHRFDRQGYAAIGVSSVRRAIRPSWDG